MKNLYVTKPANPLTPISSLGFNYMYITPHPADNTQGQTPGGAQVNLNGGADLLVNVSGLQNINTDGAININACVLVNGRGVQIANTDCALNINAQR